MPSKSLPDIPLLCDSGGIILLNSHMKKNLHKTSTTFSDNIALCSFGKIMIGKSALREEVYCLYEIFELFNTGTCGMLMRLGGWPQLLCMPSCFFVLVFWAVVHVLD